MGGRRVSAFCGREVRYGDIRLGVVVDVLFDAEARTALGFEVRCGDETHRFLPLRASDTSGDEVLIDSPLLLVDGAYYRAMSRAFATLRGGGVGEGRRGLGELADVVIGEDGTVISLVVATDGGEHEVPRTESLEVERKPLRPAV